MNTAPWLLAAAWLLWGGGSGHWLLGGALAALWLAAGQLRLNIAEADIPRVVDLATLAAALLAVACLVAQGLPKGINTLVGWLPLPLLPIALLQRCGSQEIRLRHLAYTWRRSGHARAEQVVELAPAYLALTLLAAAALAEPAPWIFWAEGALLAAWLWSAQPPASRAALPGFAAASLLALAGAWGIAIGLQHGQAALEDLALDYLAGSANDPWRSDTRIGELGRIKLSERILWRGEASAALPVPLLLRDGVFVHYSGGTWHARREPFAPTTATAGPGGLRLLGRSSKGTAIVPVPQGTAGLLSPAGRVEGNAQGVFRISEAPPRLELQLAAPTAAAALAPGAAELAVPRPYQGLLQQLPDLAALAGLDEEQRLAGIEAWFGQHFRYTLYLGGEAEGGRDIERFLLRDRAGHCEYFATATVLLARSLGLPARYVTGYSLQEYSPLERRYLVRAAHAHAWAEVYVAGRWREVDTTPAIWLHQEEQAAPAWRPLADLLAFAWDALQEAWAAPDRGGPLAWSVFALLLGLPVARALARRLKLRHGGARRAPAPAAVAASDPELAEWQAVEAAFARLGLARRAGEPPRAWLARVAVEGAAVLDGARIEAARSVVERLYRRRYGPGASR